MKNQETQLKDYALSVELKPGIDQSTLLAALRTMRENGGIETFEKQEHTVAGVARTIVRGQRLTTLEADKTFQETIGGIRHWLGNIYSADIKNT